jgi:hypothetical protein
MAKPIKGPEIPPPPYAHQEVPAYVFKSGSKKLVNTIEELVEALKTGWSEEPNKAGVEVEATGMSGEALNALTEELAAAKDEIEQLTTANKDLQEQLEAALAAVEEADQTTDVAEAARPKSSGKKK